MFDIVRRALGACPELISELQRRGLFLRDEMAEVRDCLREHPSEPTAPLGSVQFATLLANGDAQLTTCAVARGIVTREELVWINRLLKLKAPNATRDELTRTVERRIEGRESYGRPRHPGITGARKRTR
ncbi:MAG TPA: hypothetical protein VMT20_18650 [Terriglobia bacterium]|nr:hypothetical protein [Terriglobia bacterium]